jgi:hypothetical protein
MGVLERRRQRRNASEAKPRAVVAAAMPLAGPGGKQAWQARAGDEAWQKQAWYFYDAIGELHFAYGWLANAVARAVPFAAEKDPETGKVSGPTDDPRAQAAAAAIFGGTEQAPQIQSTLALQWQVGGETFILIRPTRAAEPDEWFALSATAVRERGGTWTFEHPMTGAWEKLRPGTDKLIRVWSPHPNKQTHADSATRAALPVCAEIEKTSQAIAARLDSRLAGNGVLFIPTEIDFPVGDGEQANAAAFMNLLLEAAEASIQTPGTAAAQVPIVAQVPGELVGNIQHMDLSTQMDDQLPELREAGITRLGRIVDMPKEIALGQVAESNHWTAWQIEETTYKIHVEPFLLKLGSAITVEYFRAALRAMGVPDPERFIIAWDITEVVAAPDDSETTKYLFEQGLISNDYTRSKFGVPDDAIPSEQDERKQLAKQIVMAAPTTLENASVAEAVGFEPTGTATPPGAPALPAPPEAAPARSMPERQTEPGDGLTAAAELVVFDALSRAGGRLLTRQYRGQFSSTPKHELHTVIPTGESQEDRARLMADSFQFVPVVAHGFGLSAESLEEVLRDYVGNRLHWGDAHDRDVLRLFLRRVSSE